MEQPLNERDRKILGTVVEEFVQTAEPVGSRYLTKKHKLDISPATVRNVMADLEELGFLVQPHTSAGRKPTDRGYRYYVDHLMGLEPLPMAERRRIRKQLAGSEHLDVDEVLDAASWALSAAARHMGVVSAPRFEANVFRRVDFVLLRPGRILVILVARSGGVHHRPVEAEEVQSQDELDQMANYLNSVLHGLTLYAVKEKILSEMASEKALYDKLLQKALALGNRILEDNPSQGELHLGDPSALFEHPEFATADQLRAVFEAFEKKGMILKLLERASEAQGVQVLIGQENPLQDLRNCAIVSAPYGRVGTTRGSLGVIGPTRMDYARVIGLVHYMSRLLGEALDSL